MTIAASLPRTQAELDALIGVTNGKWRTIPMEKITIQGQVQGFGFSYERQEESFDEEGQFLQGAVAWLKGQGAEPYAGFNFSGDGSLKERLAEASSSPAASACPTHGAGKLKTWPDGGVSCSAFSKQKEEWSQDGKPGRNGVIFYCAWRKGD